MNKTKIVLSLWLNIRTMPRGRDPQIWEKVRVKTFYLTYLILRLAWIACPHEICIMFELSEKCKQTYRVLIWFVDWKIKTVTWDEIIQGESYRIDLYFFKRTDLYRLLCAYDRPSVYPMRQLARAYLSLELFLLGSILPREYLLRDQVTIPVWKRRYVVW